MCSKLLVIEKQSPPIFVSVYACMHAEDTQGKNIYSLKCWDQNFDIVPLILIDYTTLINLKSVKVKRWNLFLKLENNVSVWTLVKNILFNKLNEIL